MTLRLPRHERLRRQAVAEVVALIRGAGSREPAAELAAALRRRRPGLRRGGRHVPGQSALVAGTQPAVAQAGSAIALEQRVTDHPDDLEACLDLAQTYLEAGQPREASQRYVEVLKRDPNNPEATTRLALLVYEAGDTPHALSGVEKVLAQHPDHPEALFVDGVILLNGENRPQDAIAPLQRYLQVAPTGGYRDDARQLLQQAQGQTG